MNDFRSALDAYLAGRTDIHSLESTLRTSLQRQPHLAAAHSAIIEAMFRTQRLSAQARDSLHKVVQSVGQPAAATPAPAPAPPPAGDKTQFRAPPAQQTPPAQKAPPTPPAAESGDKTQFRMPAAPPAPSASRTPPTPPTPPSVESGEKTQFRLPRPGPPRGSPPAPGAITPPTPPASQRFPPAPPAPTAPASADRTQLRARPLTTGQPPAAEAGSPGSPVSPPRTPATSAPQARSSTPPAKPGSLADLLGGAVDEPQASQPSPVAPSAPPSVPSSPTTTGGTGPVTTGSNTGSNTGNSSSTGTGGWTGGTGPSTGRRTGTGSGSGGSWANLKEGEADAAPLAPGDTIKDRFVLEDIIGKGGMGIVFKARDLRWEEAQDRHPYVAVKVLNEDFKRHPESLKALQRESRKAQNLAHPNVVTVYQFDRDGANVFMVMELLEGEPLDKLIKRNDAGGLPPKTALKYTAHMARALAYAHEQGIIHSDFKPANAYMTRDGIVKVFDFGISRAAKRSDKVSGSMTLFDPGTLGALTPAYASCEMIDGLEPDPRDDIYALACVFYELLTGRHPFDKKSAVQARDAKLVPAQVRGLSRAQWRGLQRGLSFSREQRTPSVMQFLNEVSPQRRSPAKWIAVAASVVVVGVAVALFLPGYLEKRRLQEIADIFRRGEAAAVPDALERLAALTPEQRGTVLNDQAARDGLLSWFEKEIDAATDEAKQKYDFAKAFALIGQARKIFTDSSRVENKSKSLEDRQNDLINRLRGRFDAALARGWLIDKQNAENATRVLEVLAKVKPDHPLLTDQRLVIAHVEQARGALQRANVELAQQLIASGLKLSPENPSLKDLGDSVRAAAASQASAQRVSALHASIDTALGGAPSLEAFDSKRSELTELRAVAPDNPALARWQSQMQTLLDRRLVALTDARSFSDAEALLGRYADLASAQYVAARRDGLTTARREFTDRLASLTDSLQQAIRAGRLGPPAPNNARTIYQSLDRAGANAEQLATAKDQIATAYLRLARDLRSRKSFDDARKQVTAGLDFGPTPTVAEILRGEKKEIDDAELLAKSAADAQQQQQLAAQKAREDDALKAQLAAALKVPRQSIASARSALELAEKLQLRNVKDPLVQNAKRDIQNQLVAEIRATNEQAGPDAAIRLADQATALLPDSTALTAVLAEVRKASADRALAARSSAVAAIRTDLDTLVKAPKLDDRWNRDVNAQLRKLSAYMQDTDPYVVGVKRSISNAYIASAQKSRAAKSLSEAERLLGRAAEFTPNHPDLAVERKLLVDARAMQDRMAQQDKLAADTNALKQKLRDQTRADDPDFLLTLTGLKQVLPAQDSFLTNDAPMMIAESYTRMATKRARSGNFDTAVALLDKGLEFAPALRTLRDTRTQYARLLALSEQINSGATLSEREFRTTLDALAKSDPGLSADVTRRLQNSLEVRIRNERSRNPTVAASLESSARQIFPDQARVAAARPQPAGSQAPAAAPATPPPTAQTPAATPTAQSQPTIVDPTPGSAPPAATPGAGGKACQVNFQRLGKRSQAVCYDSVAGVRGPDLVVLPAGGPFSAPVSVMRYEVSNADYNFYCTSTGRCKVNNASPLLPVVSVGAADAERYAAWLTEATGKTYRLPNDTEWNYIASEIPDRPDFNCTVELGGQKIRGQTLVEGKNGLPTNWGVYNIVGNAQEWAKGAGGWVARGGAFSDVMSSCTAALGKVHSGQADGKTGFRLIREF